MKKSIVKIVVFTILGFCASCTTDNLDVVNEKPKQAGLIDPYAISAEDAIDGMYKLMDDLYGESTRVTGRWIVNIETLKGGDVAQTRSEKSLPENLAYIVNFDGEGGYAILGADQRVPSVLCIVESGSMTLESMKETGLTNAIVSLFAQEKGNKKPGCYPGKYNPDLPYATLDCNRDGINDWPNPSDPESILPDDWKPNPNNKPDETIGHTKDDEWKIKWNDWYDTGLYKEPLIKTKWYNYGPFDLSGNGNYVRSEAIALAQIFAFHEKPSASSFDVTSTWAELKSHNFHNNSNDPTSLRIRNDMAQIVRKIVEGMGLKDFDTPNHTGINQITLVPNIDRVVNYLNKAYYSVKTKPFEILDPSSIVVISEAGDIISMLDNNRPVFVNTTNWSDHGDGWLIDGYQIQRRTNKLPFPYNEMQQRALFHCSFGWGGTFDGWYSAELIDNGIEMSFYSEENNSSNGDAPNVYFGLGNDSKIITYSLSPDFKRPVTGGSTIGGINP
jgi:hypothetical protein